MNKSTKIYHNSLFIGNETKSNYPKEYNTISFVQIVAEMSKYCDWEMQGQTK